MRCNSRMLAINETTRHAAATMEVCREVMLPAPELKSGCSFQIPALENEHGSAQRHRRIEQRVERVLHDQLQADRLLMGDGTNHVERGKVWHQVSRRRGKPASNAMGQSGESAQVVRKASNHEQ